MLYDDLLLIIADSSFYICFLKDINKPHQLELIINKFMFNITEILVKEVIKKSENSAFPSQYPPIEIINSDFDFKEILRPFFSKKELDDGETEVIELVYQWYKIKRIYKFILDEREARLFVERNIVEIKEMMIGTVGFIGLCYYDFSIFNKKDSLQLLTDIENSDFHVSVTVINNIREKINNCNNNGQRY